MKFLHLGDLHLGRSLGSFELLEDQKYILEQILRIAVEKKADAILVAGDVYDRTIPSEAAVELLNDFLCKVSESGIKVFLISGNHDSDERLNFGSALIRRSGVHIASKYGGQTYRVTAEDEFGEVNFYLLPFMKAAKVRQFHPSDRIESYDDAAKAVIAHMELDPKARNVLVAHQYVTGSDGEDPITAGSEVVHEMTVGNVEKIYASTFRAFDYVALGHIHSPQKLGRETVRYSGSPLKYSLSEVKDEKSVPLVTMGEKGNVTVELIPLVPKRALRHLTGTVEELLHGRELGNTEDFIYATITEEKKRENYMGIFQQVYPNTVKIDFQREQERLPEEMSMNLMGEKKSFGELVSDFYKMIYGTDISEEEMKLLREVGREAGVTDETD